MKPKSIIEIFKYWPALIFYFTAVSAINGFVYWKLVGLDVFQYLTTADILPIGLSGIVICVFVVIIAVAITDFFETLRAMMQRRRENKSHIQSETQGSNPENENQPSNLEAVNLTEGYIFVELIIVLMFGLLSAILNISLLYTISVSLAAAIFIHANFVLVDSEFLTETLSSRARMNLIITLCIFPIAIILLAGVNYNRAANFTKYEVRSIETCEERYFGKLGNYFVFHDPKNKSTTIINSDNTNELNIIKIKKSDCEPTPQTDQAAP